MTDTASIKRHFFDSLKRGTGEAYLILKDNPTIDFSTYIIKGALRNYAYDGQSEDSRAKYIFDLTSLTNKKEKIRKAVLSGLKAEQDDTWTLTHLFDLAKLYAQQGDSEARQTIYEKFLNHSIEGSDWVGYSEILELDGLKGLLFIAEKFGKHIEQNPDDWQDDWIIRHFQDENKELKVYEELGKSSKTNKFIKLYIDNIKQTEKNRNNNIRETQVFTDIIDEILNSKPFLSYRRSKELTEIDLNQIANKLIIEKDNSYIEKLIEIFSDHKFPLDSNYILKFAKQKANSKNRINEFAISALKFLKSESIREFALVNIPKVKQPESFINILISNYKKGDFKLLTDIAKKAKSEHIIECLAGSYVDIFTANKTTECKEPLEILYNKMNCAIHRNGIIEVLMDNNVLQKKLKAEIKYDSYLKTRELLDRKKNGI